MAVTLNRRHVQVVTALASRSILREWEEEKTNKWNRQVVSSEEQRDDDI